MKPLQDAGKKHAGRYVALYRVSTDKQGEVGLGMKAQLESVMQYLNGGTWTMVGAFTEVESSRMKRRPQLEAALALCKKEKATLIIARLDRLYRNAAAVCALIESGVPFVCCDNPYASKMNMQMLGVFAEHERDLISERTSQALGRIQDSIVKHGHHVSKAGKKIKRLGNTVNPEVAARKGRKALIAQADDYAAKVMPIVRELNRQGYTTLREIAHGLAMRGIETRRGSTTWHPSQVSNLLKRRA